MIKVFRSHALTRVINDEYLNFCRLWRQNVPHLLVDYPNRKKILGLPYSLKAQEYF